MVNGPISAETPDATAEGMIKQGREFAKWHKNVYVKVPCTIEGLKACQELTKLGIHVNVTLVFSANQILLAAKSGAALISPFVGRLVDAGEDGMQLIAEGVRIINAYGFKSQILVASIRNPGMVTEAAILGAHVATMPFAVLKQMYEHPLTDKGIEIFNKDWAKVENK
jgi:transaldolase